MNTRFEDIEGQQVRVREHAAENAPVVVLMNSWMRSLRMWDAHWELLGSTYRLIAVDMPGFGASHARSEYMTVAGSAGLLSRLMSRLQAEDAHIIAPNVMGPVALRAALNGDLDVRSVVLCSGLGAHPVRVGPEIRTIMESQGVRRMVGAGGGLFVPAALARMSPRGIHPAELEEIMAATATMHQFKPRLDFMKDVPIELAAMAPALRASELNVLALAGARDPFFLPTNATALAEQMPGCVAEVWPNSGSYPQDDDAERFDNRLKEWVFGET